VYPQAGPTPMGPFGIGSDFLYFIELESTMAHTWTKRYFTIINGEGYELPINFGREGELEQWEDMIDEVNGAIQNIYYAIYMEEGDPVIESLAETFLSWVGSLRRQYGAERVPQDVRLQVHEFERFLDIPYTDFGIDHGIYIDQIGGAA